MCPMSLKDPVEGHLISRSFIRLSVSLLKCHILSLGYIDQTWKASSFMVYPYFITQQDALYRGGLECRDFCKTFNVSKTDKQQMNDLKFNAPETVATFSYVQIYNSMSYMCLGIICSVYTCTCRIA